jgi:hypothetical protein
VALVSHRDLLNGRKWGQYETLLDEYEFGDLQIKYLSPDKTQRVVRLIQTLPLQLVDLSEHTRLASDGFHDVPPEEATDNVL